MNHSGSSNLPQTQRFFSSHHTFDIHLATLYGMEEAVLIQHFQYWITFNKNLKRNFREGRTWTYQTRKEIQAHFPYWNEERIRYLCKKLVNKGVLIMGKFNKNPIDTTLWYAFKDEAQFILTKASTDDGNSNNVSDWENSQSSGKIPTPYKDTHPITHIPSPKKEKESEPPPEVGITSFFFEKLKEINPKIRLPNMKSWGKEMERLKRVDKRSEEEIKQVIEYIVHQHKNPKNEFTWSKAVASPDKLRKHFAKIWLEMTSAKSPAPKMAIIETNKKMALRISSAKRADITLGYDYIEFINGPTSAVYKFDDKDFLEKCNIQLHKRSLKLKM